ncbi:hypothetical protein GO003_002830 [Methylicorpusculum oleiharenae]|uniref:hypothetical protein n=1 Tax=Methylicorpusculum oleiharenae TaxID=1338687 RepID=UPI0013568607|nr:hypothetical protein [Methylicorpusculum oleiharenae]MCD2449323.1 hypothetical protein [Methylicorpusculum oleiharenae]
MIVIYPVSPNQRRKFEIQNFADTAFHSKVITQAARIIKDFRNYHWQFCEIEQPVRSSFFYPTAPPRLTLVHPYTLEQIAANNVLTGMISTSYALQAEIDRGKAFYRDKFMALKQITSEYADESDQVAAFLLMID